jgi:23S rRNA (cytosine1962-C5)-methyltransferase
MPPPSPLAQLWPSWHAEWIRHQDAELVAIDKPAGMASQPDAPGQRDDACSRLGAWLAEHQGAAAPLGIVQRLDRLASGLVVYGRTKRATRALGEAFHRGAERRYLCGVEGLGRLGAHGSRDGLHHRVVERSGPRLLVEIATAHRRHRIREQLAELGAPLGGDVANGGPPAPRLMLHLGALELSDPADGRPLALSSPPPDAFAAWLRCGADVTRDAQSLTLALRAAAARRFALGTTPDTDTFRLCHGAGDGVPGVAVDRYGDWLVASVVEPATERRELVLDVLASLGARGIYLKLPPRSARRLEPARLAELAPPLAVRGEPAPAIVGVREHGLRFGVSLGDGLSTGLFLDQRANRQRVRAAARGRRVLNLFAYSASFTVAAIAGGATVTVTVDVSRKALDRAASNIAMLGAPPGEHRLERADAGEWLERAARRGERFDLVVLDPPSFATTKHARFSAAEDFGRLASSCLRCLAPGGQLLACTNHRGLRRARLAEQLAELASSLGCRVRRLEHLPPPVDFPPPPGEECHLKALWLELES